MKKCASTAGQPQNFLSHDQPQKPFKHFFRQKARVPDFVFIRKKTICNDIQISISKKCPNFSVGGGGICLKFETPNAKMVFDKVEHEPLNGAIPGAQFSSNRILFFPNVHPAAEGIVKVTLRQSSSQVDRVLPSWQCGFQLLGKTCT